MSVIFLKQAYAWFLKIDVTQEVDMRVCLPLCVSVCMRAWVCVRVSRSTSETINN